MSDDQSISFFNHAGIGVQVASQVVHGSVYHTTNYGDVSNAAKLPNADASTTDDDLLASLAFPEMFDRRSTIEAPHPSTCQWILTCEEFKTWMSMPQGILWIKGKPGAGKSTIMSFMYTELKKQQSSQSGVYLDFFFSARGGELQKTPSGMLRSLLNQLFIQHEKSRPLIRDAFHEKQSAFGAKISEWCWQQQELEILLFDAVTTVTDRMQINLFIDALDEAGGTNAQKLARFFHKINDSVAGTPIKVKICLSCRHYPVASMIKAMELIVEDHNGNDISQFIRDRLNLEALEDDSHSQNWQEIKSFILTRANGIFQWANLVVIMVEESILRGDSPKMVQTWLKDVPSELYDCYEQILRNQINQRDRPQSTLLFALVCYAKRSSHFLSNISGLFGAEHHSDAIQHDGLLSERFVHRRLKTLSGGLVEVLFPSVQIIQIIHQSVYDFLMRGGFNILFELEDRVHDQFASSVVRVETLSVQERCHAVLHRRCLDELTAKSRLYALRPWVSYALDNLFVHAQHAAKVEFTDMVSYIQLLETVLVDHPYIYCRSVARFGWCTDSGSKLIHYAAAYELSHVISYLLKHRSDVNLQDGHGNTALHIVSASGYLQLAQFLIAKGADPTLANVNGRTWLYLAVENGHTDFIAGLLQDASYVKLFKLSTGLLTLAASRDSTDLARVLLDYSYTLEIQSGAFQRSKSVNSTDNATTLSQNRLWSDEYGSALRRASRSGQFETVKMIKDVIERDGGNQEAYQDALYEAVQCDHLPIVKLLLQAGANLEAESNGRTALCFAAAHNDSIEVVEYLVEVGAKIKGVHPTSENAFHIAVSYNAYYNVQHLKPLVDRMPDKDEVYREAMRKAVEMRHYSMICLLFELSPDSYDFNLTQILKVILTSPPKFSAC